MEPARKKDALGQGTCQRCGILGEHATAGDCIEALRDALADVLAGELKRHERAPSRL
jgi:hypothetical protein